MSEQLPHEFKHMGQHVQVINRNDQDATWHMHIFTAGDHTFAQLIASH